MLTLILCICTVLLVILSILFKPKFRIGSVNIESFWVIASIGALLLLVTNSLSINEVYDALTMSGAMNPIKLLVIFLSMSGLSLMLDTLGFFKVASNYVLRKASHSHTKIFIYLYITVSILTVFTSNDIIILTFTPIIIYFSKRTNLNPIPLLVSQFVAANTWSLMLIIGNPTNIYLASKFGIDFISYLAVMFFPTLITGVFTFGLLYLVFRKTLKEPIKKTYEQTVYLENKFLVYVTLIHLILCTLSLSIANYIQIQMHIISLFFLCSNALFLIIYQITKLQAYPSYFLNSVRNMPWNLVPFILSMFMMVIGLNKYGLTKNLFEILNHVPTYVGYGIGSFFTSNMINNIPMSVLFVDVISHATYIYPNQLQSLVYSAIIGSNIGAYLTPLGSLAGIMWLRMLKKEDIDMSFKKFVGYGVMIAIPTMVVALITLYWFL